MQREKRPKRDAVFAFGAQELVSRLDAREVAFARVAEVCVPAETPAEEEAEEPAVEPPAEEETEEPAVEPPAEEEAEEPAAEAPAEEETEEPTAETPADEEIEAVEERRRREEAEARAREAVARAAEEQRRREEAERQRNEKEEEAEVFEQAVDVATRRMEQQKRFALWGGAAGVALLLLLAADLGAVGAPQAPGDAYGTGPCGGGRAGSGGGAAAAAPAPAPYDCVLTGRDGGGAVVALNLRRDALVAPGGAVIGRDPARSSHVVVDPSMSRAHARVYVRGGGLHVEDLGSTQRHLSQWPEAGPGTGGACLRRRRAGARRADVAGRAEGVSAMRRGRRRTGVFPGMDSTPPVARRSRRRGLPRNSCADRPSRATAFCRQRRLLHRDDAVRSCGAVAEAWMRVVPTARRRPRCRRR